MKRTDLIARTMPTLSFFAIAFHTLRKKSSRRTAEGAMLLTLFAQAGRFAQAVGLFPPVPFIRTDERPMSLIVTGNDFYASLWPGPIFWMALLSLAWVCGLAGMMQITASIQVTRHRGDHRILRPKGEDDPEYLNSVPPEWMLMDVCLRRFASITAIATFFTFAWVLFWHTGFAALLPVALLTIARWVDDNLSDTAGILIQNIKMKREAEKTALQMVAMGVDREHAA